MSYTKTNWVNEGPPALDADNLNKIEQGIFDNDARLADIPKIDHGYESFGSVANNSYTDLSITFNKVFSSPPDVIVGLYATSTAVAFANTVLACHTITATGFKARFYNESGSSRAPGVYWIAVGS